MKRLWTPWRMEYIEKEARVKKGECFLCSAWEGKDDELLVFKGKKSFIIMNKYPYNSGHVMVCPSLHTSTLEDIDDETKIEIFDLLNLSIRAIRDSMNAQGFNIGVNLGKPAGAGLEEHIHFHVVPRWVGDTNFMPIISQTKVLPEDLNTTKERIKKAIQKIKNL